MELRDGASTSTIVDFDDQRSWEVGIETGVGTEAGASAVGKLGPKLGPKLRNDLMAKLGPHPSSKKTSDGLQADAHQIVEGLVLSKLAQLQETVSSTKQSQQMVEECMVRMLESQQNIEHIVSSTKLLLSDAVWLQLNSRPASPEIDSSGDVLSSVIQSQHKVEKGVMRMLESQHNIEKNMIRRQDPVIPDVTIEGGPKRKSDDVFSVLEERILETLYAIMEPRFDSMLRRMDSLLCSKVGEDGSVQDEAPKHREHPSRIMAQDISLKGAMHPQRLKCNRHIQTMKQRKARKSGVIVDLMEWLKMRNPLPHWFHCSLCNCQRSCARSVSDTAFVADEKPSEFSLFVDFVNGPTFGVISIILIAANVAWMGFCTNSKMEKWRSGTLGEKEYSEGWHKYVDVSFACAFSIEIFFRCLAAGPENFFYGEEWKFNLFDFFVIVVSYAKMIFFNSINMSYFRLISILRLMRAFYFVRLFRVFSGLRSVVVICVKSMPLLLYTGLLLALWMYVMSIALMEVLVTNADSSNLESVAVVKKYYGSLGTTMHTLLQIGTSGELWGQVSRETRDLKTVQTFLFVFIAPLLFCLFPIIYGKYCWKVFDVQRCDMFLSMHRRASEGHQFVHDFKNCLRMLQVPLDEELDPQKLHMIFEDRPALRAFLETAGISALPEELLALFTPEGGVVTMREFIYGCQWLKLEGANCQAIFLSEQLSEFRGRHNDQSTAIRDSMASLTKVFLESSSSRSSQKHNRKAMNLPPPSFVSHLAK